MLLVVCLLLLMYGLSVSNAENPDSMTIEHINDTQVISNTTTTNSQVNTSHHTHTSYKTVNNKSQSKVLKKAKEQENIEISTDNVTCQVGDVIDINVSSEPANLDDGILTYYINKEIIGVQNISISQEPFEFDTDGYDAGTYNLTIDFSGSLKYKNTGTNATITINKHDTDITITDTIFDEDNNLNISYNLISGQKKVNTGTLTLYYNDTMIKSMNITEEDSSIIIPNKYNSELIDFVYTGNNYYESFNTSELINVDPLDCDIYIPYITGYHGSNVTTTVTIYSNKTVNDGKLDVYVDDILIDEYDVTSSSIPININLENYLEGKYNVTIVYGDSNVYNEQSYNTTLTVRKIRTNVYTSNVTAHRNNIVNLTATIYNYVDDKTNGLVEFFIDNESIATSIANNSHINITYLIPDNLDYGMHNLTVVYYGTQRYNESRAESLMNITKYTNKLYVKDVTLDENGRINIDLRCYSYDRTVDDGVINIIINGTLVDTVPVTTNDTIIILPNEYQADNVYTASFTYENSSWYNDANTNQIIDIERTNTTTHISKYLSNKNILNITTYVYTTSYDEINNGTMEYYLNNNLIGTSNIKNNTGNLIYNMTGQPIGNYTITAKYLGTKIYKPSTNTTTITKTIHQTTAYITTNNTIRATPGDTIKINATINDYEGNPITETIPTTIIINNKTINTQFTNGTLNQTYKIPENTTESTITITITTKNTTNTKPTTRNATLKITKYNTYITGPNNIKLTKLEQIQINTTINSNKHQVNTKIPTIIKINNKTLANTYYMNGSLKYKLNLDNKYINNTYTLTIMTHETSKYRQTTKTINLILNNRKTYIISKNIYSSKGNKIIFNATVMDALTRKPIQGTSKACIKLNNVTVNTIQIKNGHIAYPYSNNNNAKTYNITIISGENNIYDASQWTGYLINKRQPIKITSQNINTIVDSNITIKAKIFSNEKLINKTIKASIKINNVTIGTVNVVNGQIILPYKLPDNMGSGIYNLTIVTGDTGSYYHTNTTTKLIVSKKYKVIDSPNISVKKNGTIHIKAVIKDSKGNIVTSKTKVNIKVAGKSICNLNVTNGIIEYDYNIGNLKKGKYDLLVQAGETSKYRHATTHSVLRVE